MVFKKKTAQPQKKNDEAKQPVVKTEVPIDESLFRQKGESHQAYNERVPVAIQPVQPMPTKSYLGKDL